MSDIRCLIFDVRSGFHYFSDQTSDFLYQKKRPMKIHNNIIEVKNDLEERTPPHFSPSPHRPFSYSPLRPLSPSLRLLILLSVLYLLPSSLFPAILTVKPDGTGDFTIIQEAIDAAAMQDTVLVWPGTWYENLHIDAKPITLAGLYLTTGEKQYISRTIVDGSTIQNSVIVADNFPNGEQGTICGFTIQNGDARYNEINFPSLYMGWGGGILMYYADMDIIGCLIQGNTAQLHGGGIKALYSALKLSCTIIKNNRAFSMGGGVWFALGEYLFFDTINLNSIYFNHSTMGNDLMKHYSYDLPIYQVDTATTLVDHGYCIFNGNDNALPVYDIELVANHAMIDQVEKDVYVSPDGNNTNSGLSCDKPLKNIWYAMTKIKPDTNNKRTVHVMPGTYGPSNNDEIFPLNARSNSCLVGENMNTCILDAEQTWFHYSCHPASYSLTIKNLTLINGNSFIDEIYDYAGAIDFDWAVYNPILENLLIENCIGIRSSGAIVDTWDIAHLHNITGKNNFGGRSLRALYAGQQVRESVFVINCSSLNNSFYQDSYGSGGGIGIFNSYTSNMPLISSISGLLVCNNQRRDWWGGSEFLSHLTIGARISNITNLTIAGNTNENNLPGAYATWENMTSRVYNSIFYGNEHPSIILGVEPPLENPGELYIDYSLIEQGLDDIWNQQNFNILHYGVNNIEGNPLFAGEGEHPYGLQAASPCINTGTPMYEEGMEPPYIKEENGKYILYTHEYDTIHLPETDIAGNPRIAYGRIDMGAYEFVDTTVNIGQRPPKYLGGKIKVVPNPYEHSTAIKFTLLKKGHCIVKIHDLNGRPVKTLLDTFTVPGNFEMRWHSDYDNGNKIPSGHYIISVILDGKNVGSVKVRRW